VPILPDPRRVGVCLGIAARHGIHQASPPSESTKHTLALTDRGGAITAELRGLAAEIRDGSGPGSASGPSRKRTYGIVVFESSDTVCKWAVTG
jgi:hypothetical protein